MGDPIPAPAHGTDIRLDAVLANLARIEAILNRIAPAALDSTEPHDGDPIELNEPEPPAKRKS